MAITSDMSFWINTLIFNKLAEICPTLNLNGEDRRIYELCIKDFKNYVLYLTANHPQVEDLHLGLETDSEMGDPLIKMIITSLTSGLEQDMQTTKEVTEFIDMWVRMWFRKWQQRTKIILKEEELPKGALSINNFSINGLSGEEQKELMGIMIDKLIQYGEICCTEIIADSLIKKAIGEIQGGFSIEKKLSLISKIQRQARDVSLIHGPLVFIQMGNYFKLREWRNDGTMSKIF
jgi:hypothetical protein